MDARRLAIEVLARVEETDAFLGVMLDHRLAEGALTDPRDVSFVTELCYGTARRRASLDHALSALLDRPLEKVEPRVRVALRIGAYQLLHMRVPARAAVAATVESMKHADLHRATGFVNAVLRRLSREPPAPLPESPAARRLAIEESHPEWLVERWLRRYGPERTATLLKADNTPPAVTLRVNTTRTSRDALLAELREMGLGARPTERSSAGIVLESAGRLDALYGHAEGLWQVQDEAAQLVGLFADIPEGAAVLDVCAAPGGKACHLAERGPVLAVDLHPRRLQRVVESAERLGLGDRIRALVHDATEPFAVEDDDPDADSAEPGEPQADELDAAGARGDGNTDAAANPGGDVDAADEEGDARAELARALAEFEPHAVVIDAPCTGLGTLRRHPELRWRVSEEDVGRMAKLQRRILERCQAVVPIGGLLIYAVCSTEPQEGADQIELFLRTHPDFTTEPPTRTDVDFPLWQGHLRTLPGPEGMDGFFAARLRRIG